MRAVAAWGLALCALIACSRPKDDAAPHSSAPLPPHPPGASVAVSALPPPPATAELPTPEDEEEDSAHRITEKNLESELDRLEREIQGE